LKALVKWSRDYHGINKIHQKEEYKGNIIPEEYRAEFIYHINSIYKANITISKFKKGWVKNFQNLRRYLADIPIEY